MSSIRKYNMGHPFTMLFLILFYILLKHCLFSEKIVYRNRLGLFMEKKNFRNMSSDKGMISVFKLNSSCLKCARVCLYHENCKSFFLNTMDSSMECRLIEKVLTKADATRVDSGRLWHYFVATKSVCPTDKGYIFDEGSLACFRLVQEQMRVSAARSLCEQDGGELLRIQNDEENMAVVSYLKQFDLKANSPTIDGYRAEYSWIFPDGTLLQYFNWAPGQPEDRKHCLKMLFEAQYKWAVARCSRSKYFLCGIPLA